jgi:hypothetical protein
VTAARKTLRLRRSLRDLQKNNQNGRDEAYHAANVR